MDFTRTFLTIAAGYSGIFSSTTYINTSSFWVILNTLYQKPWRNCFSFVGTTFAMTKAGLPRTRYPPNAKDSNRCVDKGWSPYAKDSFSNAKSGDCKMVFQSLKGDSRVRSDCVTP